MYREVTLYDQLKSAEKTRIYGVFIGVSVTKEGTGRWLGHCFRVLVCGVRLPDQDRASRNEMVQWQTG